jgi:hypothetical protein
MQDPFHGRRRDAPGVCPKVFGPGDEIDTAVVRSIVAAAVLAWMLVGCGAPAASPSSLERTEPPSEVPTEEPTADEVSSPSPAPTPPGVADEDRDGDFLLTLRSPRTSFPATEPLEIEATLVYDGTREEVRASGSSTGLVAISISQLDGTMQIGGLQLADCAPYSLRSGEAIDAPLQFSGGYGDDDPNIDFYRAFYEGGPPYHLPPGRWRVDASAGFFLGQCDPDQSVDLRTSIEILTE